MNATTYKQSRKPSVYSSMASSSPTPPPPVVEDSTSPTTRVTTTYTARITQSRTEYITNTVYKSSSCASVLSHSIPAQTQATQNISVAASAGQPIAPPASMSVAPSATGSLAPPASMPSGAPSQPVEPYKGDGVRAVVRLVLVAFPLLAGLAL